MKNLIRTLGLIYLTTIVFSCTKDKYNSNYFNDCATPSTLPEWTKTLRAEHLIGTWKIESIVYGQSYPTTKGFDTLYYPNNIITLNSSDNGTLYFNNSIKWVFRTRENSYPSINFINIGSLFPFNFLLLNKDTLDLSFDTFSDNKFSAFFWQRKDTSSEQCHINFIRL